MHWSYLVCSLCFLYIVWDIPGNEKGHKGLLGWKVNFFLPPTNERKYNWKGVILLINCVRVLGCVTWFSCDYLGILFPCVTLYLFGFTS